jgi:L-asparaginase II
MSPLQIQVYRGPQVESSHLVDAVVVDSKGDILATFGDPNLLVYPRSMIKPAQALVFVMAKAFKSLSEPDKAIALACASHNSEEEQIAVVEEWLKEIKVSESDLVCGPQEPEDKAVRYKMIRAHESTRKIYNNCSGKHAGLISACLARNWPVAGYANWDHPLQKELRKMLTLLSGYDHDSAKWGTDGCGIPTYALPLSSVAKMMSSFLRPESFQPEVSEALKIISAACAKEPWMIGGHDTICSEVNAATHGKIFAKIGAEGNYAAISYADGFAIALKARDGAFRACEAAVYHLLEKFSKNSKSELSQVRKLALPELRNRSGDPVGRIEVLEPNS